MDFLSQSFEDTGVVNFNNEMLPFEQAKRHYSDQVALNFARWTIDEKKYLDVHCTVWTPESFTEVFDRVGKLGILNIELSEPYVGFDGCISDEFLVYMRKTSQ